MSKIVLIFTKDIFSLLFREEGREKDKKGGRERKRKGGKEKEVGRVLNKNLEINEIFIKLKGKIVNANLLLR